MGSRRRRIIVLVLGVVAIAMFVLYPVVLPPIARTAPNHAKAQHLLAAVVYLLAIIIDLGAMALVAAREVRGVFDDYRTQRHEALNQLIASVAKPTDGSRNGHNGKPLE
jgi:hypothetical protein